MEASPPPAVNQSTNVSGGAVFSFSFFSFFFDSAVLSQHPNDTLLTNFPVARSDSPDFEGAAQWLY